MRIAGGRMVLCFRFPEAASIMRCFSGIMLFGVCISAWSEDLPVHEFSSATCFVLGVQFTKGPDGPPSPVLMQWSHDGGITWEWLFGGENVRPGVTDTVGIEDNSSKLVIKGQSVSQSFLSNGDNVLAIKNGEKLSDFLAVHHIGLPFGNQRKISSVVQDRLDRDGCVQLKGNQLLLLFELGTDDAKDPAYDFQDVVMMLEFDDLRALTQVPRISPDSKRL